MMDGESIARLCNKRVNGGRYSARQCVPRSRVDRKINPVWIRVMCILDQTGTLPSVRRIIPSPA